MAEGAPPLRENGVKSIVGSNPTLSAIFALVLTATMCVWTTLLAHASWRWNLATIVLGITPFRRQAAGDGGNPPGGSKRGDKLREERFRFLLQPSLGAVQ